MYGLIGKKLGHSYSKIIHEKLGYSYDLIELKDEESVRSFLGERKYEGLNVTIPYKKVALDCCDEVSDLAKRIGAVNTLYFSRGPEGPDKNILKGDNTDYVGLAYAIKKAGITENWNSVLILGGTGGAGAMAKVLAEDFGAKDIYIASRNSSSVRSNPVCYNNCKLHKVTYEHLPKDVQIIINATPVGTYPNTYDSPVDLSMFTKLEGIIDLVYNPLRTELIMQAEEMGIPCTGGLPMLVYQAVAASQLFHGGNQSSILFPDDLTEKILGELDSEIENIVLIGMPGCGKSSIGKRLAKATGRKLIDTDIYIKEQTGKTSSELLIEKGEAAFRKIETECVKELAKEHSLIIATGGGVPMNPRNIHALKMNGKILFLDRAPEKLSTFNRPLSQNGGVYKLYDERYDIYNSVCDIRIENNGEDFSPAADEIIKHLDPQGLRR